MTSGERVVTWPDGWAACGDCLGHAHGSVDLYDGDDQCSQECHPGRPCSMTASACNVPAILARYPGTADLGPA